MRILGTVCAIATVACLVDVTAGQTTVEVLRNIYHRCSNDDSILTCAKPKVLSYLKDATLQDRLLITDDLAVVRSRAAAADPEDGDYYESLNSADLTKREQIRSLMLEKLDAYLSSHALEATLPRSIAGSDIVPRSLIESVPKSIRIPLVDSHKETGRGFVKKVMIPFLLGLKFKATALVPLALALIALKTWKALTLGLLSLVLSGAMLIFKLTKPKVAYEVLHYGHPPIEHPPHWEAAAHGPYRAYRK